MTHVGKRAVVGALTILRDIVTYPCFSCDHSAEHFCLYRGQRCTADGVFYRGVYSNYDDAAAAVPRDKNHGFDSSSVTGYFQQHLSAFNPGDYPVLLRLCQVLHSGDRVFDLGGGYGQSYYAYQRHIQLPKPVRWMVCDVSAFTQLGAKLAREHDSDELIFTENWQDADGASMYLTNGTLQYIKPGLSSLLQMLSAKPPYVLVNRIPTSECATFYTVQYGAGSYSPYKIMNTAQFIGEMSEIGYQLMDQWSLPRTLRVPLHPECETSVYRGFYFVRQQPALS